VRAPEIAAALGIGSSIAVNGCCLTVVKHGDGCFELDLSGETLRRTSFGDPALRDGTHVNLERPLAAGAPLGGHFVQGHVDGVGRVARLLAEGENGPRSSADRQRLRLGTENEERGWWLTVRIPEPLGRCVALKGSIAVDGISLTVASWQDGLGDFAIIPFTYAHTNVQHLAVGDPVNLECDILAKYVERLLEAGKEPNPSRLTVDKLIEEGF